MIFAHSSAHSSPESTRVNPSQSESSCRYSRWSWPTGSPSTMKTRMVSCNWRQVGIGRYREHGLHDERNWWLAAVLSTPRLLKFSNFAQPGLHTAGCWLSATLDRCRWDLHKGRQRTTRWTGFLITRRWWDIPFSCYEVPWTWKINDDHLSSLD